MRQGRGAEEKAVSGGGIGGENREGILGLWITIGKYDGVRYLGQVRTAREYDRTEVLGNLQRARKSSGRLSRILIREGADPKVSVNFLKAVTQAVLLFREETWVMKPGMEQYLSSFQNRVARRLTGRQPRRRGCGSWEYPSLEEEMTET